MVITVGEILKEDFFKDYKILAGSGGLDNKVQGSTVFDAPDGFKWTRGKEFIITSGYVFYQNLDFFYEYAMSAECKKTACLAIKVDRYLKVIPKDILEIFDKNNIPLLDIPNKQPFMDILSAINVIVMNKNIRQFDIGKIDQQNFSDLSYQVRKINKILNIVEYEMKFPAMVYDLVNEKAYYSSIKFKQMSADLKIEDFWNPSFDFSKEVLCDNLKMSRYRFFHSNYDKPYSWITVPIKIDNKIRAYFVVIEATELIDYYDQFALRIGFILLQGIYEQILFTQSIGDLGFSDFLNNMVTKKLVLREDIVKQACDLNIKVNDKYYVFVMEQSNEQIILSGYKALIKECVIKSFGHSGCRMCLVDDNLCLFIYQTDEKSIDKNDFDKMSKKIENLKKRLELEVENINVSFGISDIPDYIYEVAKNYTRSRQALKMGKYLFPETNIWTYSKLGVFAWLDIKDEEFNIMMDGISKLINSEDKKELIETLKAYLECKMNFSLTSEKLFLHINTVRKRIEKIVDIIDINLNDATSRLKLEVLLKLM